VILLLFLAAGASALFRTEAGYVIGAKGFPEQYILAALMNQRLSDAGLTATTRDDLGSAVIFNALAGNDVDAYIDYSGTIWTNTMHRSDVPPRDAMLREMSTWLQANYGVRLLGPLGFENAYVLAMRRDRAAALGIQTIADLAAMAPKMAVGGDYEIFSRPEWRKLRETYGLAFRQERQMQPLFMYKAAADGEVDVITAFSSDGRISEYDLVTLQDPLAAIPPYDAILLLAPGRSGDTALAGALKPLLGKIPVERMREANLWVSRETDQLPPAEAARRLWTAVTR